VFNIVKRQNFMLGQDVPAWQEAEELRLEKYGKEYVVIQTCQPRDQEQNARLIEQTNAPEKSKSDTPWWFWPMFAIGIIAVAAMAWGGG
jgi:hypothetical protein